MFFQDRILIFTRKNAPAEQGHLIGLLFVRECVASLVLGKTLHKGGTFLKFTSLQGIEVLMYQSDFASILSSEAWTIPISAYYHNQYVGVIEKIFPLLEESFVEFVERIPENPMKSECYLPMSVGEAMKAEKSTVRVYSTDAKWYGVTYSEDKEKVMNGLRALVDGGVYPDGLWK